MSDSRAGRRGRSLLEAAGLVAIYATRRVLQLVWRKATGNEPPAGPDDREASLGRAMVWSLLLGALATTARMIAIRYASRLLPRIERQDLPSVDKPGKDERPDDVAI
jgi:Protein of unknown function (DUF4235)